ncbi:vanw domain protein, putative [Heliomicrobium modesticaldum Ice1]|uniref:Vanw domain protein, putative n=1 Tax=Heliobacterium modesticaldum (strain ATCC 51547 / Ice1) TaxID=498761 RepID=B0TDR7_HELMI|nr:VanW family protein [Heliomicrobium modesticaldum]ABZ82780.1 vanw domain protein, putative [Heliomicrobium modesticaldum Ice1]
MNLIARRAALCAAMVAGALTLQGLQSATLTGTEACAPADSTAQAQPQWQPQPAVKTPKAGTITFLIGKERFTFVPGQGADYLEPGKWSYLPTLDLETARQTAVLFADALPKDLRLRDGGLDRITSAILEGEDATVAVPSWVIAAEIVIPLTYVSYNGGRNASTALDYLDGYVLKANETFSFNEVVGPRSAERGFITGMSLIDNRFVQEQGGGICFASTIVHQAVSRTDVEIVEQNHHSRPVAYVPRGGDATVYYGELDYRFRNGDALLAFEKLQRPNGLGLRLWKSMH